jgi:hypothetical protein
MISGESKSRTAMKFLRAERASSVSARNAGSGTKERVASDEEELIAVYGIKNFISVQIARLFKSLSLCRRVGDFIGLIRQMMGCGYPNQDNDATKRVA